MAFIFLFAFNKQVEFEIMHNYAIAEIAGKQFRIQEGEQIEVPRLDAAEGDTITLDKMLLVNKDDKVTVGTPFIEGAGAEAKVIAHSKGRKVPIIKKKPRKGYRRQGTGRAHLTTIEVSKLTV